MNSLTYPLSSTDKKILKDAVQELMPSIILDIVWDAYFYYQSFFESLDGYYQYPLSSSDVAATGIGTNTTVAASFTPTVVPIASSTFADGITYDSTNKRFTITKAGKYLVIGFAYFSNPSTADVSYQTMIYQNGSKVAASYSAPHATGVIVVAPAAIVISCAANDYIELYAQTGSSSTQPVSGVLSYLSVAMIGSSVSNVSGSGITLQTGIIANGYAEIGDDGGNLTSQNVLSWDKVQKFRSSVSISSIANYDPTSIPPQVSSHGNIGIYAGVFTGTSLILTVKDDNGVLIQTPPKYVGFIFEGGSIYGVSNIGHGILGSVDSTLPTKQILLQPYQADKVYLLEVSITPKIGATFYVNGANVGQIGPADIPVGKKVGMTDFFIETLDTNDKQMFSRFYEYIQQK